MEDKEEKEFWIKAFLNSKSKRADWDAEYADNALKEYKKRFKK